MLRRLHLLALRTYRRLPRRWRWFVVRRMAPTFTVGSICVVERPDGALLLVRQSYRDGWAFPGGLLRRREDPVAAGRREVREEVGLDITTLGEPAVVVDTGRRRVDVIFRARCAEPADSEGLRPQSPEILEVRWFGPPELPELQLEAAMALAELARSFPAGPAAGG